MKKTVLISGLTGQDGSYLAELLLDEGLEVHGLVRRSSRGYGALQNIKHLVNNPEIYRKRLFLHAGDLGDASSIFRIVNEVKPDYLFSLAAQADVADSFWMPEYSIRTNGEAVVTILEAVRQFSPKTRFYQASTSELFGEVAETPQNEKTVFNPQSPYSIGKWVAFQAVKKYREMYGLYACNGILFNHASPRRTDDYLDRKVTKAVARIKYGLQKELRLGNLEAYRDWGYSKDYVRAMWLMLQQDKADDYCIGTGVTIQVKDWVQRCFDYARLDMDKHVVIDQKLFRPAEVNILKADCRKAEEVLGWKATVQVDELIKLMLDEDLRLARQESLISSYDLPPNHTNSA